MKYLFIKISHMYDGLEFRDNCVCSIPDDASPFSWATNNVAKKYRDVLDRVQPFALRGSFSFENGSHIVTIESITEIKKREFNTLRKHL